MKLVVVGGQARKVGKTSVICGLIRGLKMLGWTAVKISYHGGEADAHDAPLPEELPPHLDFLLSEERDREGRGDTSLYLAAGARRALWLRARGDGLARGLPALLHAVEGDEHVVVESNSLLGYIKPGVFLMVMDESGGDVKGSARQFLACADAFVAVKSGPAPWPAASLRLPEGKPVYPVSAGEWLNRDLCQFVRERLGPPGRRSPCA